MIIGSIKIPSILFIKGVYKKDCSNDDIFEKKILENTPSVEIDFNGDIDISDISSITNCNNFVNYEKLPNIFESIETWQKKTKLKCWNCTLSFTSIPVFIPKVIEPNFGKGKNKKNYSISVHGVFCTFACAKQHVENRNYSLSERVETLNKLKLLYKLFYGDKMKDTPSTTTPFQMKQYGGDLTEDEYLELRENTPIKV
jgi:hypothetical protein